MSPAATRRSLRSSGQSASTAETSRASTGAGSGKAPMEPAHSASTRGKRQRGANAGASEDGQHKGAGHASKRRAVVQEEDVQDAVVDSEPIVDSDRVSNSKQVGAICTKQPQDDECSCSHRLDPDSEELRRQEEPASDAEPDSDVDIDNDSDSYNAYMDREECGPDAPDGTNQAHPVACLDQQVEDQKEVAGLLGVDESTAMLLLRSVRWNKDDLLTKYMEDAERVCAKAGVPSPMAATSRAVESKLTENFECSICRDKGKLKVTALACGHEYCDSCWERYISLKVSGGQTLISCPEPKCSLQVGEDLIRKVCSEATLTKYQGFLVDSRVAESLRTVWCPKQGCGLAVDASASVGKFVTCQQRHSFCIECMQEAHAPAACDIVKKWLKKCDDDSETMNWLSAHTQDCPLCHSTIEKNGGCNHMTCRKCKHEFCWVCMSPWLSHTDFYTCNRYDAEKIMAKEEGRTPRRTALDRYLFHYHRYMNHDTSRKLDQKNRERATEQMEKIMELSPERQWGDLQFLEDATEGLSQCRLVLKWTYVLAHFLEDNTPQKDLFCDLQQMLEKDTERLSGLLESEVEKLMLPETKSEVLVLMSVANKSRQKLLVGVEERLMTSEA